MKIIRPDTEETFEAPTQSETEERYLGRVRRHTPEPVGCRCRWSGLRGELQHEVDIEQMHPQNRNNPHCTMTDQTGCHYTAFEKCPKCKRYLFADGRRMQ